MRSYLALAQILAVVMLSLGVIYGYGRLELNQVKNQLAVLTEESNSAMEHFTALQVKYPPKIKSDRLTKEVARMETEWNNIMRLSAALSHGAFGNTTGFSSYLEGLAKQHVKGTWLTQIVIAEGGENIRISGRTIMPELVPTYMQQLGSEPAFAGKIFHQLELNRDAELGEAIDFTFSTGIQTTSPDHQQ